MIKPILCNLRKKHLSSDTASNSEGEATVGLFRSTVWDYLSNAFQEEGSVHDALWVATLVDPRFKRSLDSQTNTEERARILRVLKQEVRIYFINYFF